ncbi:MAG TPA: PQQ-dependent sugar dehydrogenase [Rubricoccaceae bacterium]|nr:PQQ-dependent sugar dehydrogenase [Rubricoccaceae bacterium]
MRRSLLLLAAFAAAASAQTPEPLRPGIAVERLATVPEGTLRLARAPSTGDLYTLTGGGDVYRLPPPFSTPELVATATNHSLDNAVWGLEVSADGTLYVVGNEVTGVLNVGMVMRGTPNGTGGYTWSRLMRTEPHPVNGQGVFDHFFNAVQLSPDGASLFVNSGSRTEHGELQDVNGQYPGLREGALNSVILRVPANAQDLVLPNDLGALEAGGYLFADGFRNTFDLALDGAGRLYGTENSGDRDDGDELNRIVEDGHYGFPWRMGDHDTPQQFPGYDPEADLLLNHEAWSYQNGFFYNDPTYPPRPAGVTFIDPVRNLGPDADHYRSEADGSIRDGSDDGIPQATFTPHCSPLGLAFDRAGTLPAPYTGDGLMLRWTSGAPGQSVLFEPFGEEGEDLVHLDFHGPDTVAVTRLVRGFAGPMDAVLVGQTLYVIELGGTRGLWALTFSEVEATELPPSPALALRAAPSPFRNRATVTLTVEAPQVVRMELVDALGRRVALLHDGALGVGPHAFTVDGARLPAGVYAVRVQGPEGTTSRRLVRVR